MLFTTTTQYLALAVALIAGWLFGLASHPGGGKWKQRYADEREVHATARKDIDARLAAANARIKELERDNAQLAKAVPVAVPTATVVETPAAATPAPMARPAPATRPAYAAGTRPGWFDWSNRVGPHG